MLHESNLIDKVKKLWSQKAKVEDRERRELVSWMVYPLIAKNYINKQVSGNSEEDWLIYIKNTYIPHKLNMGLDIGCGDGWLERRASHLGICKKFDAFDVAEGAIKIAKKEASKQGIDNFVNYEVRDINNICLEREVYDIAFTTSSAHHFKELEHIFNEVNKALKPSGFFILGNEFVGPSQFQWTDKQMGIIDDLLQILPTKYRRYISTPWKVKERGDRPSLDWMKNYDPSEAIRSADIIPILSEYCNVIEKVDFGGTILHMLLSNIVGNFDSEKEEDIAILKLICYLEETLIRERILPSDFAVIIAQKKDLL